MRRPGIVPDPGETAMLGAAEALTVEYFARVDRRELDPATELYAEDALFLGVRGRAAIRAAMERGLASNADKRSRHLIGNLRSSALDADTVLVDYTALAYTLDDSAPPTLRSVLDQEQLIRRGTDGVLRIAEHRIFGYE